MAAAGVPPKRCIYMRGSFGAWPKVGLIATMASPQKISPRVQDLATNQGVVGSIPASRTNLFRGLVERLGPFTFGAFFMAISLRYLIVCL